VSLERVSAIIALVSAAVAVIVTLYGIYERRQAFKDERTWREKSFTTEQEWRTRTFETEQEWRRTTFDTERQERQSTFEAQQAELNRQADRWRREFEAERVSQQVLLRKDFLLEQYQYRLASYGAVLKTLGAVSDVVDSRDSDPFRALLENPDRLSTTATALFDHLYGEAGLLMTMRTRNVLHRARQACASFLASDGSQKDGKELVDAFFRARRYIRADLELLDDRSPENLQKQVERLAAEAPQP
jgi:hypothetical protein